MLRRMESPPSRPGGDGAGDPGGPGPAGSDDPWDSGPGRAPGDRYRRLALAGRGSMGTVYRALDREMGTEVAIKAIQRAGPDWIYRLKKEFRSLAGVTHPNLVQLYDLAAGEAGCFFTMEFVDGLDFVEHVRGSGGRSDDEVLRRFLAAAPQLVQGVEALHEAGHIHRDIKPTNLRVDREGRVVLLDFDLVAPHTSGDSLDPASAALAGTYAYMAPEQFRGHPASEAADWYSTGVVFYEALTGRLPVEEGALGRVIAGGAPEPTPIARFLPGVPDWLAELVEALLRADPDTRPGRSQIRAAFEQAEGAVRREAPGRLASSELVGRDQELDALRRIHAGTRSEGRTAVAIVAGSSGVGKTALVRTFAEEVHREGGALVLASRCSPSESLPYKALDAIVDALSRQLLEDERPIGALSAQRASAMTHLFPVLARVPALAHAAERGEVRDLLETRRLAVGGLRETLAALARERDLVLWIDDAQWGDLDSARLLDALLRPPDAPPLLLVLSVRADERAASPLVAALEEAVAQYGTLHLAELGLEPLGSSDALSLANELCARAGWSGPVDPLVAEAGGSPFLIQELARYLATRDAAGGAEALRGLNLQQVIARRVSELSAEERHLLELVSLCGRPIERSVVLRAARLGEPGRPAVARLESRSLVRVQSQEGGTRVEAYHDRIREAVAAELPRATRVGHHHDIAISLEALDDAEPDLLAHHFHEAEELPKAADYSLIAADKAYEALAFEHAAELYRSAREWDDRGSHRSRSLRTKEAHSLANAANLVDAGRGFLEAARDAPQLENLELRRKACEHLLAGASVDTGVDALSALLADLGLRYPPSARQAMLGTLAQLAKAWLRGSRSPVREQPDPLEAIRIDTLFAMGKSLVDMDAARGSYFSVAALSRALAFGDPYRLSRSLGIVGGLVALGAGPRWGRHGWRMLDRANAMAREIDAPELVGTLQVATGQVLLLSGRWQEALDHFAPAIEMLSTQCQGYVFETNIARSMTLRASQEIGVHVDEIAAGASQFLEATAAARNRYAETAAVQYVCFAALGRGDLAEARRWADRGSQLWSSIGDQEFHVQHLYTARAQAQCDLYAGRPARSLARFRQMWPALKRSGLMRVPLARVDAWTWRAQLELACLWQGSGGRAERRRILRHARRLAALDRTDARIQARLLRAGLRALDGDASRAVSLLDEAMASCRSEGMALRAECIRLHQGRILGGAEGGALVVEASGEIGAYGVKDPARWAAMYAPGTGTPG